MCEMKRILLLIMMAAAFSSCRKSGVRLAAEPDSLSYVIGLNVGMNLMKMDSTLNVDAVCTAIRDVYAGTQKMSLEDAKVYYLRQMNYAKYEKFKLYEERFLGMGLPITYTRFRLDGRRDFPWFDWEEDDKLEKDDEEERKTGR